MKLFEYAIIFNPKHNPDPDAQEASKILVPPKHCLAADLASAQIIAARAIPDEYISRLDQVQLAVRPF